MAKLDVPYFKWRDGRPRWEPGPALRRAGWKGRDLRDGKGEFLPLGPAIEAAKEINAEVRAWREGTGGPPGQAGGHAAEPNRGKTARTVEHLFDLYFKSPDAARLKPKTRYDYERHAARIVKTFGDFPVRQVTRPRLKKFHHAIAARGHLAQANAILRTFRLALAYGELDLEWIPKNPAARLKLPSTPPRLVLWLPDELADLIRAADDMGRAAEDIDFFAVADATVLALHTGQRQGDVLAAEAADLQNGRLNLATAKTGARISVPLTPQLEARLAVIAERKKRLSVISPRLVVMNTSAKTPGFYFWKRWDAVRAVAAARRARRTYRRLRRGNADAAEARRQAEEARAAFIAKQFLDLRDTAVTRLAEAGAELPEIMAITGHSPRSIHQILKHYLVLTGPMADNAIAKLVAHLDATGAEW